MADEIDIANAELEARLKFTLKTVNTSIEENDTGKCIWCGTSVSDRRRWCTAQCRDEHTSTYKL
tara:strand:+ start:29 stop:220 length:192 start_codon:yes stop_codon:yes gene_type:complete